MKLDFKKLIVPKIEAQDFTMSPIELKDFIDFEAKRVYYISNPKGATSAHCHIEEKELFVMVAGGCTAEIDQGHGLEQVRLQGPTDALYIGSYVWHHFTDFDPGSVLMAVSSTNYSADRSDYITDYAVYQETLKKMGVE